MRNDKRPAINDPNESLLDIRKSKRRKLTLSASLTQMEENTDFIDVPMRDEAPFSPEEALEQKFIGHTTTLEKFHNSTNHMNFASSSNTQYIAQHLLFCLIYEVFTYNTYSTLLFSVPSDAQVIYNLLSASTGCAAILIEGYTLHALMFLGTYKTKIKLK